MKKAALSILVALFVFTISAMAENIKEAKFTANMTCNTCKGKIENALKAEKGVVKYNADVASKIVTVSYDADKTNETNLKNAIAKLGYTVESVSEVKATKTDVKSTNKSGCEGKNCTGKDKSKKCND